MYINSWKKFLTEVIKIDKDLEITPVIKSEVSIFEIDVKVKILKTLENEKILITQIKDKIRGILSVTTVRNNEIEGDILSPELQHLKIKFELGRGEILNQYVEQTLVPDLRKLKEIQILHFSKIKKIR